MALKNCFTTARLTGTGLLGATLLLGAPALVRAQSIVPANGPLPAAAFPSTPQGLVTPPQPAANPLLELVFEDVKASELLGIISKQFDVPIVITSDVSQVIKFINLKNKTPEQAIQAVVTAANLQCQKMDDGTFVVGKTLAPAQAPAALPPIVPPAPQAFAPAVAPAGLGNPVWTPTVGMAGNLGSLDNGPTLIPDGDSARSQTKHQKFLRVRNVAARIMAYWVDPQDNPEPAEFAEARRLDARAHDPHFGHSAVSPDEMAAADGNFNGSGGNGFSPVATNPYLQHAAGVQSNSEMDPSYRANAQFGGGAAGGRGGAAGGRGGAAGGGGVFQLPQGVDRVVAIDPQNALLVFGTDDGIRQLQDTIAFLDRPLRQVEIEAEFVTVSTSDSRAFGIDFSTTKGDFTASSTGNTPSGTGGLQVGFVRGNFSATLAALQSSDRAKVIDAPRVTAINNLTASLQTSISSPVVLTSTSSGIGGQVGQSTNLIYITTAIGLTVTPTINNDDTVTVAMTPTFSTQTPSGDTTGAPVINQDTLQTIANVHDGDTIALGGLRTKNIARGHSSVPVLDKIPVIGKLFRSRNATDAESELIIFLKATILHRLGDDDAVPGT